MRGIVRERQKRTLKIKQGVFLLSVVLCSFTGTAYMLSGQSRLSTPEPHLSEVDTRPTASARGVSIPAGKAASSQPSKTAGGNKAAVSTSGDVGSITTYPRPAWTTMPLYVDPTNTATGYAKTHPSAPGAGYIARMGQQPVAEWFGDWNGNVTADVNRYVSAAAAAGSVPVLGVYNIPHRDCGGYSIGGSGGIRGYLSWMRQVAAGIGGRTAVVVLEPDALGALDCLPGSSQRQERLQAISQAVDILKRQANTYVYIDAGTPVWQPVSVMSQRLKDANIAKADGFSINVSYFASTAMNQSYGDQLSAAVGYKHYVIDTSRNGGNLAVGGMMCNPAGAALGNAPTTDTKNYLNDALLWIKIPWESDGQCGSSPGPGQPYWSYAVQLAKNAGW